MSLIIYNVMIKDTHTETKAVPFLNRDDAVSYARRIAKDLCQCKKDFKEGYHLKKWVYYAQYSCEGDIVWVTEHWI